MKSGDFVYIDYIGKIKNSGEIFDLTREDIAKKEGIYNEKLKYGHVPVVVDAGFVVEGLNDAIKEMNIGDKKKIMIEPEKAFGERSDELVKLIPEARFKEQGIDVVPGSNIMINNLRGKIISNDGGRVKVDFNHPLAGKILEYEIEIIQEMKENIDKIKALAYYFTGADKEKIDVQIKEKIAEIEVNEIEVRREVRGRIAAQIMKWVPDIETVKFIDVFKKPE